MSWRSSGYLQQPTAKIVGDGESAISGSPLPPEVGDVVLCGARPERMLNSSDLVEPWPALVLRVESPGDPRTKLTLMVFKMRGQEAARVTDLPHSDTLAVDHWTPKEPRR